MVVLGSGFGSVRQPAKVNGSTSGALNALAFTGPVTLSGGQASLTFLLSVGAHTVSAAYGGDAGLVASSGSLAGGQTVTPAPVAATITKAFTPSTVVFNGSSVATIMTNQNAFSITSVQFSDTMPAGVDLITQVVVLQHARDQRWDVLDQSR